MKTWDCLVIRLHYDHTHPTQCAFILALCTYLWSFVAAWLRCHCVDIVCYQTRTLTRRLVRRKQYWPCNRSCYKFELWSECWRFVYPLMRTCGSHTAVKTHTQALTPPLCACLQLIGPHSEGFDQKLQTVSLILCDRVIWAADNVPLIFS